MQTDNKKNIWLVFTKEKALLFQDHTGYYIGEYFQYPQSINSSVVGLVVYITNDEKIGFKDYYIDTLTNFIYRAGKKSVKIARFKKIIISNDLYLAGKIQSTPIDLLEYFCKESNKKSKPIDFIKIKKEMDGKSLFYKADISEEKRNWIEALNRNTKKIGDTTMKSVHRLNEDGSQTDITYNPELWLLGGCFAIKDDLKKDECLIKPLYGTYLIDNLQEIAESLVDRETNASIESPYRKTLEKYVLIGLKAEEGKITLDDMQYYMEYCLRNGYVTPQDWLTNHKHY